MIKLYTMFRQKNICYLAAMLLLLQSCRDEEPIMSEDEFLDIKMEVNMLRSTGARSLDEFKMPRSNEFSKIPQDPRNLLNADKVELGKYIYHETGVGVKPIKAIGLKTYSCATCHFAAAGFQAGVRQGIGEGGQGFGSKGEGRTLHPNYLPTEIDVQPIRTPTAMNGAFQELMLWNGQFGATGMNAGTHAQWTPNTPKEVNALGYEGLETQAIAGLKVHRLDIDTFVTNNAAYRELFDRAFPDFPTASRYSRVTAGLAIAAYERTMLSNEAPFQRWLQGEKTALTQQQKEGAVLFFGKAKCGECHKGPALNSMAFYAYGMEDLKGGGTFNIPSNNEANLGRGSFTKNPSDNYKFKVPQLYNLRDASHLGHGASLRSVREVVVYKNNGIKENHNVPDAQLAPQFKPMYLTREEVDALTDFIENALYDPNLRRYEPDHVKSGGCIPNNDLQSKIDLGCN